MIRKEEEGEERNCMYGRKKGGEMEERRKVKSKRERIE